MENETEMATTRPKPSQTKTRMTFKYMAFWFAFSLVLTQMHSFNGDEWARVLDGSGEESVNEEGQVGKPLRGTKSGDATTEERPSTRELKVFRNVPDLVGSLEKIETSVASTKLFSRREPNAFPRSIPAASPSAPPVGRPSGSPSPSPSPSSSPTSDPPSAAEQAKQEHELLANQEQQLKLEIDEVFLRVEQAKQAKKEREALFAPDTNKHTSESSEILTESPVVCTNGETEDDTICCGTWDVNADDWWVHHPDFEIDLENATHFCFAPIKDKNRTAFIKNVHERQWYGNCSHVEKSVEMNSGFGASTSWLDYAFWHAHKQDRPFQIINGNRRWLYATENKSSWASCESEDTRCYWLPISSCSREETIRGQHKSARPENRAEKIQFHWLRSYMTRPRQMFRYHLFQMRDSLSQKLTGNPCTTMHVRRGDAGFPRQPFRRYAAVQEYIDAGQVQEGDNIFLMTDDESTINEVNTHLPNYNWIYLNRPRNTNIKGGFDGHLPSGDGALEMLAIDTELQLAKSCQKVVHGQSGFVKMLIDTLELEERNFTRHFLDTSVTKEEAQKFGKDREARVQSFLTEIEALYQRKESGTLQESMTQLALKEDDGSQLICHNTTDQLECCAKWEYNSDGWWLHRPDWEISEENETAYCFAPIQNETKAQFMREVHTRQWITGNCSEREMSAEINSGLGASLGWVFKSFWHAHVMKKPFQIARSDWHWMYAPENRSSWAYCEDEDITCHTLPISPCSRDGFNKDDRQWFSPNRGKGEIEMGLWLREYMLRFKQSFRRKAYEMRQRLNVGPNCTMMHVRRADAGFPRPPFRRYAAVKEYLDAAHIRKGDSILLLTDDQSTIEEVHEKHHDYNWVYLDRPRNHGVSGGWEGHIPSGDGAFEMVAAETELRVAATCNKFVHGNSGFIIAFFEKLRFQKESFEHYYVETRVTKEEAQKWNRQPKERAADLFRNISEHKGLSNTSEGDEHSNDSEGDDSDDDDDDGDDDDDDDDSGSGSADDASEQTKGSKEVKGSAHEDANKKKKDDERQSNEDNFDSAKSEDGLANPGNFANAPIAANPLHCSNSSERLSCCGDWDIDADDWWLHNPDWEQSFANETSYCFSPMQNQTKAAFFRKLHQLQWFSGKCDEQVSAWQINSGFGASASWLSYTFLKARQENKPFQIQEPEKDWLFGPTNNYSWAFCPEKDITCYFLPISSCPRETSRQERQWALPNKTTEGNLDFEWQREYMMRPKSAMRRKLFEMKQSLNLPTPNCVTMHVRRGDAGFPRQPYRRYAAVQEYLDAADVHEGDNIMLLTDDDSTLAEIKKYHPNYNWVYMDRPRTNGVEGGWQNHVPSGQPEFEILVIFTEIGLASQCEKVVGGGSGFLKVLLGKMDMEGRKYRRFTVSTGVSKEEAKQWPDNGKERLVQFEKEMAEYRRKSNEAKLERKAKLDDAKE